jgi:hypothetical protein
LLIPPARRSASVTDLIEAAQEAIREPGSADARQFAERVYRLALVYPALFVVATAGAVLILWQGKFFVALAQRSNVETLVLAFFVVFFGYVATLSLPGVLGSARIGYHALLHRTTGDHVAVERRKQAALGEAGKGRQPVVALNVVLERADRPCEPVHFAVADEAGSLGVIVADGAKLVHRDGHLGGSNDLLAYFVRQVNDVLAQRGMPRVVDIVWWKTIDDESTAQYLSIANFARNLERHLGADELWPKFRLTETECGTLEARLRAICPALRDEAFLPDWEYAAEHKVPIIPEPLGLVSLSRSERRVDPLASMGCATVVVVAIVAVLVLFLLFPPWVPGT